MRNLKQLLMTAGAVALIAGCASPSSAVKSGTAQLLPSSVTASAGFISGVILAHGERRTISVPLYQCRAGVGAFVMDDGSAINNLLLSGDKPEDRMFRDLCAAGLSIAEKQGDDSR